MQFNPYGGTAAQLACAMVNAGSAATAEGFTSILADHDYRPLRTVNAAQAEELTAWAERLRPIFAEPSTDRRVELTNTLLAVVAAPPFISQHDGRAPHFHYAAVDAPIVHRLRAYTIGGIAHVLCDDPGRVGLCVRPDCDTVFVDTSRNGRRRFCSTRCANRTYVADHRERQRVTGSS